MGKKPTYLEVYEYVEEKGCKLITKEYIDQNTKMVFLCSNCKSEYITTFEKFKHRKKHTCNFCSKEKARKEKTTTFDSVKQEYSKKGYTLLTKDYYGYSYPAICKDEDGYQGILSYSNLKNNKGFGRFRSANPFLLDNINLFIKSSGYRTIIKELNYYDNKKNARGRFVCECGEEQEWLYSSLISCGKFLCNKCTNTASSYVIKTERFLNEKKIPYKTEFSYKNSEISRLRFDYILYLENTILLLEVDGEYHYMPKFNNENKFLKQVKNDRDKDDYCKKNNIHLLRIPYYEFKNDRYKTIIEDKINTITLSPSET